MSHLVGQPGEVQILWNHAVLQREIREHGWRASGFREANPPADLGEVSAALDETGQSLVAILASDGGMQAVLLRRGTVRMIRLGDFEAAAEAARRLNADLDALAGRRLPARLETVIRESIRHQAAVLTAQIIAPLRSSIGDDGKDLLPLLSQHQIAAKRNAAYSLQTVAPAVIGTLTDILAYRTFRTPLEPLDSILVIF